LGTRALCDPGGQAVAIPGTRPAPQNVRNDGHFPAFADGRVPAQRTFDQRRAGAGHTDDEDRKFARVATLAVAGQEVATHVAAHGGEKIRVLGGIVVQRTAPGLIAAYVSGPRGRIVAEALE